MGWGKNFLELAHLLNATSREVLFNFTLCCKSKYYIYISIYIYNYKYVYICVCVRVCINYELMLCHENFS